MNLTEEQINALETLILKELHVESLQIIDAKVQEIKNKVEADLTYLKAFIKDTSLNYYLIVESYPGQWFRTSDDVGRGSALNLLGGRKDMSQKELRSHIIAESIGYNFETLGTQSFIQLIKNKYNGI